MPTGLIRIGSYGKARAIHIQGLNLCEESNLGATAMLAGHAFMRQVWFVGSISCYIAALWVKGWLFLVEMLHVVICITSAALSSRYC